MIHYCYITGLYSRYDVLMYERQGKSLVEAGYKVTYIVCDDKPDEVSEGINIISTCYVPKSRLDRFLHTKSILLKIALEQDADIYQISDPELIDLVDIFKKYHKKVIFNMREFYPTMIARKSYIPRQVRGLVGKWYERKLIKQLPKYDAVFTVTDWILKILKDKYRVHQVHLLTNFPRVSNNYCKTFEEYECRGNVLFYEGTIYGCSRQENVMKALEQIPDIHYLLAGKMESSVLPIKSMPSWSKVEFIDGFKLSELPGLFARASICNVFRDFEGEDGSFGVLKVFESMEAALPVLFANVPLYREINEKYHCGICVDPNNVESIKAAILYLQKNKKEAYEMGQRGREAVIKEFCWERQAKKYIEIINRLK